MSRIVKFPVQSPKALGPKRVRKKRKPDLEDYGQLNLFSASKIVSFQSKNKDFFEQALELDERDDIKAIDLYIKAIESNQFVDDAYCNLGIIYYRNEDETRAVDYLTKCLAMNPRHHEAHYNLANIYSEIGNFKLAEFHFKLCIEVDSSFLNAYYNIALLYISEKLYETAISYLEEYLRLSDINSNESQYQLLKTLKSIAL